MSEQMQIIILLFAFAFLIGFFITHFILKGAYKKRYEEKIDMLGEEEKKSANVYAEVVDKKKAYHSAYDKVHRLYSKQRQYYEDLHKEESVLIQQITSLEEDQKKYREKIAALSHQIREIKEENAKLSTELNSLHGLRDVIAKNETHINALQEQMLNKQQLTQTYGKDINEIKLLQKKLKQETSELSDKVTTLKQKLSDINQILKETESIYKDKIDHLIKENSELKIRALNYEYAVKEYQKVSGNHATRVTNPLIQKLFRMPASKTKEIDNIVHKNDHNRWIDKLVRKFFSKSNLTGEEI
ncbi:MAG: hypothetical protein DSZ05_08865 [Sulfurospirillum sp.]|nr:MAG: hypothetical protein DSZ05_08865 [Sulfurospirillum sp.]